MHRRVYSLQIDDRNKWNKDNYYLLCFSKGHDDLVTYRLDKMESVKVEELEREPHPEY